MTATTHAEYNDKTEAVDVANAFANGIRGKTVIVTGVNRNGLGFSAAEGFASQSPAHLIVASRSLSRLQESIDALKAKYPDVAYRGLAVDLSSQKSVRSAAAELLSWTDVPHIDILVNNAGIMQTPDRVITEDGIEAHFATNHVGHFLLTNLLLPKLIAAARANPVKGAVRVINVSSGSPLVAPGIRWSDTNFDVVNKDLPAEEQPHYDLLRAWGTKDPENLAYIPIEAYNQSKIANVLFGIGANKRWYEKHGILSLGLHPGVIKTELDRKFNDEQLANLETMQAKGFYSYRSFEAGGATQLVAALDPALGLPLTKNGVENYGAFLHDCQISTGCQPKNVSSSEAEKLWARSEDLVGEKFE